MPLNIKRDRVHKSKGMSQLEGCFTVQIFPHNSTLMKSPEMTLIVQNRERSGCFLLFNLWQGGLPFSASHY